MQSLVEAKSPNDLIDDLKSGAIQIDEATNEAIQAFISALHQTAMKMVLPKLGGEIPVMDYQGGFAAVSERTTSSPSSLHYTLWKAVARENDLAAWQSIMMSPGGRFQHRAEDSFCTQAHDHGRVHGAQR
jgi:hypothetical protein